MALSALSFAYRNNYQTVHALEHYTKSIKSLANLQSEQELASNGQFLTHYILMIYEVCLWIDRVWDLIAQPPP